MTSISSTVSSTCESDPSRPLVVVPLREMIEHALPVAIPNSLSQYPVGESSSAKSSTDIGDSSFSNIYIHSIDEQFIVSIVAVTFFHSLHLIFI